MERVKLNTLHSRCDGEETMNQLQCYLEDQQKEGEAMLFEPTSLYLLPEKSYLGASADGKLLCTSVDTCCIGCLVIKCPYSIDGNYFSDTK